MIVPQQYTCDTPGCTQTRTETNHWFAVYLGRSRHKIEIHTWESAIAEDRLDDPNTYHFCGQTHALQFVSNEMGVK